MEEATPTKKRKILKVQTSMTIKDLERIIETGGLKLDSKGELKIGDVTVPTEESIEDVPLKSEMRSTTPEVTPEAFMGTIELKKSNVTPIHIARGVKNVTASAGASKSSVSPHMTRGAIAKLNKTPITQVTSRTGPIHKQTVQITPITLQKGKISKVYKDSNKTSGTPPGIIVQSIKQKSPRKFEELPEEIKDSLVSKDEEKELSNRQTKSEFAERISKIAAEMTPMVVPGVQVQEEMPHGAQIEVPLDAASTSAYKIESGEIVLKTNSNVKDLSAIIEASGGITFVDDNLIIGDQPVNIEPGTHHINLEVITLENDDKILTVECKMEECEDGVPIPFLQFGSCRQKSKYMKNNANAPLKRTKQEDYLSYQDKLVVPDELMILLRKKPLIKFKTVPSFRLCVDLHCKDSYEVIPKWFRCDERGKEHPEAIAEINEYLSSEECLDLVRLKNTPVKIGVDIDDCTDVSKILLKKPTMRFLKNGSISVEYQLLNKRLIYKKFPGKGKEDTENIKAVQDFLTSQECLEWVKLAYKVPIDQKMTPSILSSIAGKAVGVMAGHGRVAVGLGDDKKPRLDNKGETINYVKWKYVGALLVGEPTKFYFDGFKFDITKRFNLEKSVEAYTGDNVREGISTHFNKRWGKSHRMDDLYRYKDPEAVVKPNLKVVTCYINCAGKTSECRAKCFSLLSDVDRSADVTECSACKIDLKRDGIECFHCRAKSSRQWYKYKPNGEKMCVTCFNYYNRHGVLRRNLSRTKEETVQHEHFTCGWAMMLTLRGSDLSTWEMYEGADNDHFHMKDVVQENKRLSLSLRDDVDRLVMTQAASTKQIYKKYAAFTRGRALAKEQLRGRIRSCKVKGKIPKKSKKAKNLTPPEQSEIISEPDIGEVMEMDDSVGLTQEVETFTLRSVTDPEVPILCTVCVDEKRDIPFTCNTTICLLRHIASFHSAQLLSCSVCYQISGERVSFDTEGMLRKHCREHHPGFLEEKTIEIVKGATNEDVNYHGYGNVPENHVQQETIQIQNIDDLMNYEIVETHTATLDLLNLTGRLRKNLEK